MADAVEKAVAMISRATGNEPDVLLLGGRLGALKDSAALAPRAARILALDSPETFSWDALAADFRVRPDRFARASRPPPPDLAYFSLAGLRPEAQVHTGLDLTWSLMARAALRHFARRLPGFESSSPEHLYQNFLAGVSTVRTALDRIEVRLPHSPLAVILRLSGVWDQTYTLPWLHGVEICLQPPVE